MKLIKDKLTSESPDEFNAKIRSTKIQIAFILFCYVVLVYGIEFYIKSNTDDMKIVDILLIVRTVSKLIADSYCFVAFMKVFRFFVNKKIDANKMNQREPLSRLNKFAVGYTLV